ncbi:MAG TPA: radical SAM protein [Thermoanaerobaculia bacterium]|nr:radical SAM protein [Thermoanaerobaculia bacterium]
MIESGTYEEFSRDLHNKVNALQVPVNGTIEVTDRCPLDCVHCYNNLPMDDRAARTREMTTADLKRVLDDLADLGCVWLLLTGGEIFARHDFLEIYTHAKSRGFLITLFTNGTLVTERIADYLVEYPPFSVEITLYGATKETYEALTGIPGSYEKCFRGIKLLLDRKIPLKLKSVAVSINVHELGMMEEIADNLGLEFKFDAMMNPRIDCSQSPLAVRLSPAEIVMLDLQDPSRVADYRRVAKDMVAPLPNEGELGLVYSCGGGVNSFAIDPYGNMSICVLSHFDEYNVRDGSVREGWEKFLRGVRAKKATKITKCTRCALRSFCGSCPATAELEALDPEAPVDFLCRVAHLRADVFEIPVPEHGDCEYCVNGSHRDEIDELTAQVREQRVVATVSLPPLAASSCSTGSCSACSSHAR